MAEPIAEFRVEFRKWLMPGPFKAWAGAGDAYLVELGAGLVYLGSILVPSWFHLGSL